jgi:hypothetical protein
MPVQVLQQACPTRVHVPRRVYPTLVRVLLF